MHKSIVLLALMAVSICTLPSASAQDEKEVPKPARQFATYHLELAINELADGKKINSRHYSLNVADQNISGGVTLKIGTRVPIQAEEGKVQYLDIGTSINVRLVTFIGGPTPYPPTIIVDANVSSLADSNQVKSGSTTPLIRQVTLAGASPVVLDKPMIIASAADPESNHEFQLTVTATKLTP